MRAARPGRELASVVLPLTVSGLPIYLWWRAGNFAMPAYFDQILRVTQHVIVDSARFAATGADLRALAAWLEKQSGPDSPFRSELGAGHAVAGSDGPVF